MSYVGHRPGQSVRNLDGLLADALHRLDGTNAAVFVFGPTGALQTVALHHGVSQKRLKFLKRAARTAAQSRQAVLWPWPAEADDPGDPDEATVCFAVALVIEDLVAGVLVVGLRQQGTTAEDAQRAAGHLVDALAYAVDRQRVLVALRDAHQELSRLRVQLEAFAVDFRNVYQAEQASSRGLVTTQAELNRMKRTGRN